MDETPDDLARIREDAEHIDVERPRRKRRAIYAVGLGALMATLTWVVFEMVDQRRNPCERVHNFYCQRDPASLNCTTYKGILKESQADASIQMRRNIKHQCERKIERLKSDDQLEVP